MELSPYVSALRNNLTAATAAGDEQTRNAGRVLAATLDPATRLAIMNALSDLAAEVTLALEDRVVEVRLDGQDVQVVVTGAPTDHEPPPEPPPTAGAEGDISRITVRLFEELKARAEQAASSQGMSLNSFISQAVQGALTGRGRGRGRGDWPGWPGWQGGGDGSWQGHRHGFGSSSASWQQGEGRGSSHVHGWVEG